MWEIKVYSNREFPHSQSYALTFTLISIPAVLFLISLPFSILIFRLNSTLPLNNAIYMYV